jgi:hypothetical protein
LKELTEKDKAETRKEYPFPELSFIYGCNNQKVCKRGFEKIPEPLVYS